MLYLTNIDLNQNQLLNVILHPLATAPSNPKLGQIYYDSVNFKLMQFTGTAWQAVGVVVSSSETNGNIIVDGIEMSVYKLPAATESLLGGVMAGSGLSVDSEGRLSIKVENSLDSDSTQIPLAAAQGKVLKDKIQEVSDRLSSSYYSKDDIHSLLDTTSSLDIEVVDELPTENISTDTIYLKRRGDNPESNICDEYVYIDGSWELIGTTQIDLEGYAKTEDLAVVASTGNYDDLNNRILRVSSVLPAGDTELSIATEQGIVHSIESFDAVTGERVLVNAILEESILRITISSAYVNNIDVHVLLSLS